jgi:hypothetical protein
MPKMLVVVPAHDYLDDLEAFFWLFCYLVLIYNPTGGRGLWTQGHEWVERWMKPHHFAFDSKSSFLTNGTLRAELGEVMYAGWGDICQDLLIDFRDLITAFCKAKESSIFNAQEPAEDGTAANRFSDVLRDVNGNYARVIGLFDIALEKFRLKALDAPVNNPPNAISNVPDSGNSIAEVVEASGTNKRRAREPDSDSENENEDGFRSARQKRACPPSRIPGMLSNSDDDDDDQVSRLLALSS